MIQKLIGIEWMKIRSYKTFWIMLSLFVVGFFGLVFIIYSVKYDAYGQMAGSYLDSYFRYPLVSQLTAYMGSFMFLVLGIVLITQVTNEFSFRTHRQNIIDGLDRVQFLNAKWYNAIILSVFAGLVHVLFTVLFALMGDGGSISAFAEGLISSFYFTLDSFMWLSVAILLGIWVKRSGLAISIFIVYGLVVENLLGYLLKRMTGFAFGEYLPISMADGLCPNVLLSFINSGDRPDDWIAVIISVIYIIGLYIVSRRMIEKMDLK